MSAGQFDITIERYSTFVLDLEVTEGDTPAAKNLDGYVPWMQVRESKSETEIQLQCTPTNGRLTITDAAAGTLQLTLSAAETANLSWESGVYDLLLVSATETIRLLQGTVTISHGVTR